MNVSTARSKTSHAAPGPAPPRDRVRRATARSRQPARCDRARATRPSADVLDDTIGEIVDAGVRTMQRHGAAPYDPESGESGQLVRVPSSCVAGPDSCVSRASPGCGSARACTAGCSRAHRRLAGRATALPSAERLHAWHRRRWLPSLTVDVDHARLDLVEEAVDLGLVVGEQARGTDRTGRRWRARVPRRGTSPAVPRSAA